MAIGIHTPLSVTNCRQETAPTKYFEIHIHQNKPYVRKYVPREKYEVNDIISAIANLLNLMVLSR